MATAASIEQKKKATDIAPAWANGKAKGRAYFRKYKTNKKATRLGGFSSQQQLPSKEAAA
jgi:hypothetical protein